MITIWANESQVDVAVVDIDVAVVDVDVAVLMTHYAYIYGTYADQMPSSVPLQLSCAF